MRVGEEDQEAWLEVIADYFDEDSPREVEAEVNPDENNLAEATSAPSQQTGIHYK